MAKPNLLQNKQSICSRLWIAAAAAASILVFFLPLRAITDPWLQFSYMSETKPAAVCRQQATGKESNDPTFYDEPTTAYSMDQRVNNWDRKRSQWLKLHPEFDSSENRVLMVTGSQLKACENPLGDYFLLRLFKNKVDYCRIHGYGIYYNNAFLHPKMRSVWAKLSVIRAAMLAHPQVEWVFWVDADAVFTDMDFTVPFERYKDHNMVIHGYPDMLYEKQSWFSLNTGVFLMRNCQWSMDLLDAWAQMSPKSPNYDNWGKILKSTLQDMKYPVSNEQAALVYLILKGQQQWGEKIYVENQYALHGYWIAFVNKFDEFVVKYEMMERRVERLRRRHAEAVSEGYAAERGRYAQEAGWRRPFTTHFTGCKPCSEDHNPEYEVGSCPAGMERALNFADNQVLKNYGFVRPDLDNSSLLQPLS